MKIATRQSKLALIQSEIAKSLFSEQNISCEFLAMETKGDNPTYPFLVGKGLFVKELQEKLLNGLADVAVHSLKDMPVVQTPSLAMSALLPRASKEDVLVVSPTVLLESGLHLLSAQARQKISFEELKEFLFRSRAFRHQKMGTSSLHRKLLFQKYFEQETAPLRGNVGTRLNKVRNNEYSCTFLAKAGLERLGLFEESNDMFVLNPKIFVPSAAQGIIAIEAALSSPKYDLILNASEKMTSIDACLEAGFERLVLFILESDCYTPVGVYFDRKTLFVVTEINGKFFNCEIPISEQKWEDAKNILKKHRNIYAYFFEELCQSMLAQFVREHLVQFKFL